MRRRVARRARTGGAGGGALSVPVSLGELRQFLRLDGDGDDALLAGLARAATEMAEVWLGEALAPNWNDIPEGVRLGVLRLVASLYAGRDAAPGAALPDAVAACLAPWRRMRL